MTKRILTLSSIAVAALIVWFAAGHGDAPTPALEADAPVAPNPNEARDLAPVAGADDGDARLASAREVAPVAAGLPEPTIAEAGPVRAFPFRVRVGNMQRVGRERAFVPLVGARVSLGLVFNPFQAGGPVCDTKLELARLDTDAEGRIDVSLEVPEADLPGWVDDPWMYAQLVEPGYAAAAETNKAPNRIDLKPGAGASIAVRVLGPDGGPVDRGEARVFRAGAGHLAGEPVIRMERVGRTGSFGITVPAPGVYDLHVSCERFGARLVREVAFEQNGDPNVVVVRLESGGAIGGRLVDPAGDPIANHRLSCVPAAHADFVERRLPPNVRVPVEAGGGCWGSSATTDEDGRFSFGGLIDGAYHVRAWSDVSGDYGTRLTDLPVETGAGELTLTLALHRLHVRVLDHAGAAIEVYPDQQPHWIPPQGHALYVEECDAEGRVLAPRRHPVERRPTAADGRFVVPVVGGRQYVVGVLSRNRPPVEQRVSISPSAFRTEVALQLAEPQASSPLEVRVVDRDEAGHLQMYRLDVEVVSTDSGRVLQDTRSLKGEWWYFDPFRVEIGPGRYTLRAYRGRSVIASSSAEAPLPPDGLVEREVEVVAGQVTTVELELEPLPGGTPTVSPAAPQDAPR